MADTLNIDELNAAAAALSQSPQSNGWRTAEIVDATGWTEGKTNRVLRALDAKGWLRKSKRAIIALSGATVRVTVYSFDIPKPSKRKK